MASVRQYLWNHFDDFCLTCLSLVREDSNSWTGTDGVPLGISNSMWPFYGFFHISSFRKPGLYIEAQVIGANATSDSW